jgi:hypothetical protein
VYEAFLILHSWLRWIVIILGLRAVVRAFIGASGRRPWQPADSAAGRWFTMSLDLQFLIGLVLYALLSPLTTRAFGDMAAAMRDPETRFWAVEHIGSMIVATVLAHIGRSRSMKVRGDRTKHLAAGLLFALAILVMLAATPWPFRAVARPWIRLPF